MRSEIRQRKYFCLYLIGSIPISHPVSLSYSPSLIAESFCALKLYVKAILTIFLCFSLVNQVIRRSGEDEKILVIARKRADHVCDTSLIVVNIVLWEGISQERADYLYKHLSTVLPQHGVPTARRCGINET